MASSFPAFLAHGEPNYPLIRELPVDAAATFVAWELVFLNTGGGNDVEVCGADPGVITGLACAPASAKGLYYENISGATNKIPVAILTPDTVVGMSSSTTPAQAHLFNLYGVEKTGNNWRVDIGDTGNTRVTVVGIDIANGIFYVRFLAANLNGDSIVS